MPSFRAPPFTRLATIVVLAAALGLTACGRKGPLDPPPGAKVDGVTQPERADMSRPIGGEAPDGNPGVGPNGQPLAPTGPNKRIPLDVLLN